MGRSGNICGITCLHADLGGSNSSLAAGVNLRAGERVDYVHGGRVSAHYFDVLGIRPALGRNFSEEEDHPNGPKAAILSYSLWRTTFGADPGLIGQVIHLKGEPYTVIGILPEGQVTTLNADLCYTPRCNPAHRERATEPTLPPHSA